MDRNTLKLKSSIICEKKTYLTLPFLKQTKWAVAKSGPNISMRSGMYDCKNDSLLCAQLSIIFLIFDIRKSHGFETIWRYVESDLSDPNAANFVRYSFLSSNIGLTQLRRFLSSSILRWRAVRGLSASSFSSCSSGLFQLSFVSNSFSTTDLDSLLASCSY